MPIDEPAPMQPMRRVRYYMGRCEDALDSATTALHAAPLVDAGWRLEFLGRTSTLVVQDPVSSLRRQVRSVQEKAPPGSFIAAWYWDIESGGLDLEARGHGSAHERFDVGIPRDGGRAISP